MMQDAMHYRRKQPLTIGQPTNEAIRHRPTSNEAINQAYYLIEVAGCIPQFRKQGIHQ